MTPIQLFTAITNQLILQVIPVGILQCNCVLIADKTTRHGCIVDPGGDCGTIISYVQEYKVIIDSIYITHGHFDHFYSLGELLNELNKLQPNHTIQSYIHDDDRVLYHKLQQQLTYIPDIRLPSILPPSNINTYKHDDVLMLDGKVIHTPGHSPGSVSLYWPHYNFLCSGDTLFLGNIGRTDLMGGNNKSITESILYKLYTLPESTLVIPGHHSLTTIQYEKYNNMFVQVEDSSTNQYSKL